MEDENLDWMEEEYEDDAAITLDGLPVLPIQERAPDSSFSQKDRGRAGAGGAAGGPLAVPGFTSGRINALKAELEDCCMEVDHIDVSVDDLRVMTDAMLVEKALAEVLQRQGSSAVGDNLREMSGEENGPQEHVPPIPLSGGCAADMTENGSINEIDRVDMCGSLPKKKGKKGQKGTKRGRPFDRQIRGALLMDDTDERRKEALERLKRERERARENVSLHSLRAKRERESLYSKVQAPLRTLKFLNSVLKTPKLASRSEYEPMVEGEVLLTIEVYDNIKRYLKTQEFVVIGNQPLTALKDRIYCLTDTVAEKANDVFYNDLRHPKAIDYSLPIRKWVREQTEVVEKWKALGGVDLRKRRWLGLPSCPRAKKPPDFLDARMQDVRFADLECRIGAQFLYCHQGDCKHTLIIRDMRLVHPEDVQNAAAYPVLRYVHKLRHRKCSICCIYQARKVTVGDKLAPESPCFFCENCYYLLHYSNDGTLLYSDFQLVNSDIRVTVHTALAT